MHSFMTETLARPLVRSSSARLLSAVPGSHRTVRLLHPPAERAFASLLDALMRSKPSDPTACAGWTVHELTAHLAAGSAEIADLIELELAGEPMRPTKPFEAREQPFRSLAPTTLRRRFVEESLRATVAIERSRASDADARVAFTGAALDAEALILHAESELVLHRWDIVGDDDVSIEQLADPRLARHAAATVAPMTPNVFPPRTTNGTAAVVLRVADAPDVVVKADGTVAMSAGDDVDDSGVAGAHSIIECHPAVRTLLLWGRRPGSRLPRPHGDPDALAFLLGRQHAPSLDGS